MSEPIKKASVEPSELKEQQLRELWEAQEKLAQVAGGPGRWMPLNARLQELIDAKRPFEELVDEARYYMLVDEHMVMALVLSQQVVLDLQNGLPETADSDRL